MLTSTRAAVAHLSVRQLEEALEATWRRTTSADPIGWSATNAAWGQCAVTALIVQDYHGGALRRGLIDGVSHYWNVLDDGHVIDLTLKQFSHPAPATEIQVRDRDYVLSFPETRARYDELRSAVDRRLANTT